MKLKYYLRGLGVGILFASLIFSFIVIPEMKKDWSKNNPSAVPTPTGVTTPVPKTTATPAPKPTDSPVPTPTAKPAPTAEATVVPSPTDNPVPTEPLVTPEPTAIPDTPTPVPTEIPTPTVKPVEDGEIVIFTVTYGMSSEKTARALKEVGMIDDEGAFNSFMVEHKYDWKIMTGEYTLKKGMSFDEICKIICH